MTRYSMNSQPSRTYTTVAMAIVVAAVVIAAAILATSTYGTTVTKTTSEVTTTTETTTQTVLSTTIATSTTSIATTSCTIMGPTIGVVIRVIAYNYSTSPTSTIPVVGAHVSGQSVGYCNDALQTSTLQPTTTNSSGWASLLDGQFGLYNLVISYSPSLTYNFSPTLSFNMSIVTQPTTVTYVILNISTGNMTTHFCEYNFHCGYLLTSNG